MRLCEIPRVVMSILGFWFLSGIDVPTAQGDFTFGTPVSIGPTVNNAQSYGPCLSPDGRELYFHRDPGEIWVARRASADDDWGPPSNLGSPVNSPYYDGGPSLSADGLSLYLFSERPGTLGSQDLWVTTRATVNDNWGAPVHLGATVNSAFDEYAPCISADGLELYFTSNRSGGYGNWDLWVTTRATAQDAWGVPVNLGPTINTSAQDNWPGISPDGLLLFFSSSRPGGSGSWEIYLARRATGKDPWGAPMNLGPTVNSTAWEVGAKTSPDGSILCFHSVRSGGFSGCDMWQAPIIRNMDFNGDGKIDAQDMGLLVDNWGKNKPLCDMAPFPWGDGVVDERDLKVLMESLMTPGPRASDVPADVVLNWIGPSFANTCDVYLGTSQEAVNTASRANPQGVLVSQGKTATTYDPAGLLEFSRTYYWRVDFAIPGIAPVIYQGPVLKFTAEAFARPIKNITATASSLQRGMGPEKTVNGSGLDKSDGHSTEGADMWLSMAVPPHWIQYEFDKVYALHELWVWNSNQPVEPFIGFGAKSVKIEYSTDGTTWTPLANVPEFARATGKPGYTANTTISFGGVSAKYVKLTIEKGWGTTPSVGLSEVRFFCIQSAAAAKP